MSLLQLNDIAVATPTRSGLSLHQYLGLNPKLPIVYRARQVLVETKMTAGGCTVIYARIPKCVDLTKADRNLVWWALQIQLNKRGIFRSAAQAITTPHCLIYVKKGPPR